MYFVSSISLAHVTKAAQRHRRQSKALHWQDYVCQPESLCVCVCPMLGFPYSMSSRSHSTAGRVHLFLFRFICAVLCSLWETGTFEWNVGKASVTLYYYSYKCYYHINWWRVKDHVKKWLVWCLWLEEHHSSRNSTRSYAINLFILYSFFSMIWYFSWLECILTVRRFVPAEQQNWTFIFSDEDTSFYYCFGSFCTWFLSFI